MEDNEGREVIRLDGSFGMGADAELTIITRTEGGQQKQATYTVPYYALDLIRVQKFCDANLILGFSIVKSEVKAAGLKELGL